ncbi:MAG TPA: DUF3105 domain-containing protein [Gaiellaceae bacterium]|nr:DUF3105 domain-containing protein [Gaiellaceae bacterium]
MAKKDRVPTPPKRPVQAPKAYKAEASPRRNQLIFIGVAVVIVLAAAAIGIGFIMSGGDDSSAAGPTATGSCTSETFDAQEAAHVEELPADYEYNSAPATSGLHSPVTAIWNLYDQPVPQINYVHNLEHGGMIVQYGSDVSAEDVASLASWYQQDPRGLIIGPLAEELEEEDPTLAGQIVATSWTHMMRCGSFDQEALADFSDDFRGPQGDAPEKFQLDQLQQGAN